FCTMSDQGPAAQPSSGLQFLPSYFRSTHRVNHRQPPSFIQPLRNVHQLERERKQRIDALRLLTTVPYFSEHHERTRIDEDDADYVLVEQEESDDKMVQLTEVPDEHF